MKPTFSLAAGICLALGRIAAAPELPNYELRPMHGAWYIISNEPDPFAVEVTIITDDPVNSYRIFIILHPGVNEVGQKIEGTSRIVVNVAR